MLQIQTLIHCITNCYDNLPVINKINRYMKLLLKKCFVVNIEERYKPNTTFNFDQTVFYTMRFTTTISFTNY